MASESPWKEILVLTEGSGRQSDQHSSLSPSGMILEVPTPRAEPFPGLTPLPNPREKPRSGHRGLKGHSGREIAGFLFGPKSLA